MLPGVFRQLDEVAYDCFGFLEQEADCPEPTVEYWRDYFLAYQLADDVRLRVGMERSWLLPFLFVDYRDQGHVQFELREILRELDVTVDTARFPACDQLSSSEGSGKLALHASKKTVLESEWPEYLRQYSTALRQHFDDVLDFARTKGSSRAEAGQSNSDGPGLVLQQVGGDPPSAVIGAGSYFEQREFEPVTRSEFWKILDRGYAVSYLAATCPSCKSTGNFGVRHTPLGKIVSRVRSLALVSLAFSVAALVFIAEWRQGSLGIWLTTGLVLVWLVSHFAARTGAVTEFMCPKCQHKGPGGSLIAAKMESGPKTG